MDEIYLNQNSGMGVEGKNVSELELQDLVTRHGVRSGRGGFWVDDLVSRLASRRRGLWKSTVLGPY